MRAIAAAILVAGGISLTARADDKPLDRAEVDKRSAKVAYDAAYFGTQLWQDGNYEGTFRWYQGNLRALRAVLDHRPKLVALIDDRLEKSFNQRPEQGAFVLREALDAVMAEAGGAAPGKKPGPKGTPTTVPPVEKKPAGKPLKERLGGEAKVKALARDAAVAVLGDPKVDFLGDIKPENRAESEPIIRGLLTEQFAMILGTDDPARVPTGVAVGWADTLPDEPYRLVVGHLKAALEKAGIGAADVAEAVGRVEAVRKAARKK